MRSGVVQRGGDLVVRVEGEEGRVEGGGRRRLQALLHLLAGARARRRRLHVRHAAVRRGRRQRTYDKQHTFNTQFTTHVTLNYFFNLFFS